MITSLGRFVLGVTIFVATAPAGDDFKRPPLGLTEVETPEDNPLTELKAALGKRLFFDKSLSSDGKISCATCHVPEQGFAQQGETVSTGVDGARGRRNAPSLLNVAFLQKLFHDGRSESLEDQAWQPILAADEMGNGSEAKVLDRLAASPSYVSQFRAAFGVDTPSKDSVAQALASFQRTLLSGNSPFDQWYLGGESGTLTSAAVEGYGLFVGQAQCWQCHPLAGECILFTDQQFHKTGISSLAKNGNDAGRKEVTGKESDNEKFRTPSLRNVALTPPYMHDGSLATLRDVVEFYNTGGGNSHEVQSLGLSDRELNALVAFLESLTGDHGSR
jgi:cytochrome c peroxidase